MKRVESVVNLETQLPVSERIITVKSAPFRSNIINCAKSVKLNPVPERKLPFEFSPLIEKLGKARERSMAKVGGADQKDSVVQAW